MKYFLILLATFAASAGMASTAYATCAFDAENPFAPCNGTVGTLDYPKTPDETIPPPLKQMKLGIKLGHIICDSEHYPAWNTHYKPACVYPDSEGELLIRGWEKLRLMLPASPYPVTELEVMGQNVFSLRVLGNYIVGDEEPPFSYERKRELAWEYSQQYHPGETYLEYAITPYQNHYNVGDKVQFDLLEWGNYTNCWNLKLRIIDVQNKPVYEYNHVKYCAEHDGKQGTFHSYSMGEDFEEFVCDEPGYYRIEVSNGDIFPSDILENFACLGYKPEPESKHEMQTGFDSDKYYEVFGRGSPLAYKDASKPVLNHENCDRYAYWLTEHQKEKLNLREDYPRYPPWGNEIFPLVEYCTGNGELVKTVEGNAIHWEFKSENEY